MTVGLWFSSSGIATGLTENICAIYLMKISETKLKWLLYSWAKGNLPCSCFYIYVCVCPWISSPCSKCLRLLLHKVFAAKETFSLRRKGVYTKDFLKFFCRIYQCCQKTSIFLLNLFYFSMYFKFNVNLLKNILIHAKSLEYVRSFKWCKQGTVETGCIFLQ